MGLFGKIIKNAVGEGISNAVTKAMEETVAPAAERLASLAAEKLGAATAAVQQVSDAQEETSRSLEASLQAFRRDLDALEEEALWPGAFAAFPKWEFSPITNTESDETDEYILYAITVSASEEQLRQYRAFLGQRGFTGNTQIQKMPMGSLTYYVDFTFAEAGEACELRYLIYK